jgi:hypothetical protein
MLFHHVMRAYIIITDVRYIGKEPIQRDKSRVTQSENGNRLNRQPFIADILCQERRTREEKN